MEGFCRKAGRARMLLAKEKKGLLWAEKGSCFVDDFIFLRGIEGAHVTDYFISTDENIPHWPG